MEAWGKRCLMAKAISAPASLPAITVMRRLPRGFKSITLGHKAKKCSRGWVNRPWAKAPVIWVFKGLRSSQQRGLKESQSKRKARPPASVIR